MELKERLAPKTSLQVKSPLSIALPAHFGVAQLILVLMLGLVGALYWGTATDPDLWWHLRNGQVVLERGVVHQDIYSFTAAGQPWVMQGWLSDVLMYAMQSSGGYALLVIFFATVSIGGYFLLYRTLRRSGSSPRLAVALLGVCVLIGTRVWGVRPQILSLFFFTLFLAVLVKHHTTWGETRHPNDQSPGYKTTAHDWGVTWLGRERLIWLLPPLTLLWANLHGGYSIGLILVGLWLVGEGINSLLAWRPTPPLRPLLAVAASCLLAALVTPNGLDTLLYPLSYVGSSANTVMRYTREWQPPDVRSLGSAPFTLTLFVLLLVTSLRPRHAAEPSQPAFAPQGDRFASILHHLAGPVRGDATLPLGLVVFLFMGLQAQRILPFWGAFWAVSMASLLPQLWPELQSRSDSPVRSAQALINALAAVALLTMFAFVVRSASWAQLGPQPKDATFPVAAVTYLSEHPQAVADPLYHEYKWGGYLIAKRWPAHLVYIDGRQDMYRGAVLDDYLATQNGGPDWQAIFAKYGFRGALVERNAPLAKALAASADWRQVCCETGPGVLFVKK